MKRRKVVTLAELAARAGELRGLECQKCGCRHFYTVEARPTWGKQIRRRRQCRHCGTMKTTYEADHSR